MTDGWYLSPCFFLVSSFFENSVWLLQFDFELSNLSQQYNFLSWFLGPTVKLGSSGARTGTLEATDIVLRLPDGAKTFLDNSGGDPAAVRAQQPVVTLPLVSSQKKPMAKKVGLDPLLLLSSLRKPTGSICTYSLPVPEGWHRLASPGIFVGTCPRGQEKPGTGSSFRGKVSK